MRRCVLLALLCAATGTVASGAGAASSLRNCGRRDSRLADRTRGNPERGRAIVVARQNTACFAIPARSPRSGFRVIFRPA